jgi:hypothetical protein
MPIRLRKLIGLVALLLWIFVYAILAMSVGVHVLPGATGFGAFLYYAVAGLSWVLPILPLIRWMQRPDPEPALKTPE